MKKEKQSYSDCSVRDKAGVERARRTVCVKFSSLHVVLGVCYCLIPSLSHNSLIEGRVFVRLSEKKIFPPYGILSPTFYI